MRYAFTHLHWKLCIKDVTTTSNIPQSNAIGKVDQCDQYTNKYK